jgi:ATP-dependent DNA helicase RecG
LSSNNLKTSFDDFILALSKPLEFAARNNYQQLSRIKDLEKGVLENIHAFPKTNLSDAECHLIETLVHALPKENASPENRIASLEKCLEMLKRHAPSEKNSSTKETRHPLPFSPEELRAVENLAPESSLQFLKGVGPRLAEKFSARGLYTIEQLLRFLPRRYEIRRIGAGIAHLNIGQGTTIRGEILTKAFRRFGRRSTLEVAVGDDSGVIRLKWFRVPGKTFAEKFIKGKIIQASGQVTAYRNQMQIVHPETQILEPGEKEENLEDEIIPIYPEIDGIRPAHLRKVIGRALPVVTKFTEALPEALLQNLNLPTINEALHFLHQPQIEISDKALQNMDTPWHQRLIYEELLFLQLAVLERKGNAPKSHAQPISASPPLLETAKALFSFTLTNAQTRTLEEIEIDLQKPIPMNRLLQGDVGSGKTAVALAAASGVAAQGYQVAIMAPTEILAEQHARIAIPILKGQGIRAELITGHMRAAARREKLERLKFGIIQIAIGTHALIQNDIEFKNLALAVVDEQHRFGVKQRARLHEIGLVGIGKTPHTLLMTATPIPRTLALTVYGDLDLSLLDELPPGRKPVLTKVFRDEERHSVYAKVREAVNKGTQAFIVYPLVNESEKETMAGIRDATNSIEELKSGSLSGLNIALLHGQMPSDLKEDIMNDFLAGKIQVLVATTVIEVGIDVKNATVMVIEHAERFGLSQLHQLRGRVGRGEQQSSCYLLSHYSQSEDAFRRLQIMEHTNDGFKIAEEDLAIRGPGDFLGTRQSGLPDLSIANIVRDQKTLLLAHKHAHAILALDPLLELPEHQGLKHLIENVWRERFNLAQIA